MFRIAVAAFAFALLPARIAPAEVIDLTGLWLLTGAEESSGLEWTAEINIVQEAGTGDQRSLSGFFDWHGEDLDGLISGIITGFEDFEDGVSGTQSFFDTSTTTLLIEGHALREVFTSVSGLTLDLGVYTADVTPDGMRFINGSWSGGFPGDFEAVRVPEPSSAVLLGFGVVGLLAYGWRRRKR